MNVFNKILRRGFVDDLTETTWWTDAIFRGLEHGLPDEHVIDSRIGASANQDSADLA